MAVWTTCSDAVLVWRGTSNACPPPHSTGPTFSLSASSAAWLCTTSLAGSPSVESSRLRSLTMGRGLLMSTGLARKARVDAMVGDGDPPSRQGVFRPRAPLGLLFH